MNALFAHFLEVVGGRESGYVGSIVVDDILFCCLGGRPFLSVCVMDLVVLLGARMPVRPCSVEFDSVRIDLPEHFHRRGVRRRAMLDGVMGSLVFNKLACVVSHARSAELVALLGQNYAVIELCAPNSIHQADYMINRIITKVVKSVRVCGDVILARGVIIDDLMGYAVREWRDKCGVISPR